MASSPPPEVAVDATDLWANLPADLIINITKRLTISDRTRFRAVCRPWRSSAVAPPSVTSILNSVKVPLPYIPGLASVSHRHKTPSLDLDSSSYKSVPFEFRMYYIKPATAQDSTEGFMAQTSLTQEWKEKLPYLDEMFTHADSFNCFSLLDYRVYELGLYHGVKFLDGKDETLCKLNVIPSVRDVDAGSLSAEEKIRLISIHLGNLVHWEMGDDKWSHVGKVDDNAYCYSDVVYRKNKGFYAVDNLGNLAIIDSDLKVDVVKWPARVDVVLSMYESRMLLESNTRLYLVLHRPSCKSGEKFGRGFISKEKDDVRILIFRFDDGEQKWKRVRKLGDHAFFVGHFSSYAVAGRDFPGLRVNCVYFQDFGDGMRPGRLNIFDVETGNWGPILPDHPHSSERCNMQ